jgi:hypothetical protein
MARRSLTIVILVDLATVLGQFLADLLLPRRRRAKQARRRAR